MTVVGNIFDDIRNFSFSLSFDIHSSGWSMEQTLEEITSLEIIKVFCERKVSGVHVTVRQIYRLFFAVLFQEDDEKRRKHFLQSVLYVNSECNV